jgi:hypothetical protein
MSDAGKSSSAHAFSFIYAINHFLNIKYDRVLKLKRTESYRAWRDTAELLLDALGLWDLLTGKEQSSTDDDDKKQDYIDRKRNCILFLFQITDVVILLILTANKKLNKI